MAKYTFQWRVEGTYEVEAGSRNEAAKKFDAVPFDDIVHPAVSNFEIHLVIKDDGTEFSERDETDNEDNILEVTQ